MDLDQPAGPADYGFTLLELLVVIVIIGLLLSLVPSLSAGLERARLRTVADEVAADLEESRELAVTTGRRVDVVFDPIHLSFGDPPHPLVGLAPVVRRLAVMTRLGGAPCHDLISFFPDGSAFECAVALTSLHAKETILIDGVNGRVRHED